MGSNESNDLLVSHCGQISELYERIDSLHETLLSLYARNFSQIELQRGDSSRSPSCRVQ